MVIALSAMRVESGLLIYANALDLANQGSTRALISRHLYNPPSPAFRHRVYPSKGTPSSYNTQTLHSRQTAGRLLFVPVRLMLEKSCAATRPEINVSESIFQATLAKLVLGRHPTL